MAASGTYLPGSAGQVRTGSDVAVAGITKWSFRREVGEIETSNFESALDANSVIEGEFISDNISNTLIDIEGFINFVSLATINTFAIGTTVTLDLINNKTGKIAYLNISCFVKSISPTVELKQGQKFSASLRVFNTFPAAVLTGA